MSAINVPQDVLNALKTDDYVYSAFLAMPPSHKQRHLNWIDNGKDSDRPERISETIKVIRKSRGKSQIS